MDGSPHVEDAIDHEGSTCPAPLDCGDLAETFRTDKAAAVHLLKTLSQAQLNLQALAYVAYLNQLHSLDLKMDDILTGWQRGLGFDTR
jgi:hypothetical protein